MMRCRIWRKRLIERRTEIFAKEYLPTIRPFSKAREMLERLRADGFKLVVATSANDDDLRGLLRTLGAEWLLEDATSSSDADRSKPDPDIVRAAVDKTGVGPASCLMIGDTPYDVAAATRAGVRIIGLRCGGWGDEDLKGAIAIHDDPAELLARYDQVGLFGGAGARRGRETAQGGRPSASGDETRG